MKLNNWQIPGLATFVRLLCVTGMLCLAAGCTHKMKVRVSDTAHVAAVSSDRIPLRVGLVLDPAFCSYKHEFKNMGDTWQYTFGPHLQKHVASVCEQAFQTVVVSTNGTVPEGVEVILAPEVHRTGYALGGAKFMFTMLLEWTMRNSADQRIVWMETVEAQAADSQKRVFQSLFDQLDNESYRAFRGSPEIARVAAHTTK